MSKLEIFICASKTLRISYVIADRSVNMKFQKTQLVAANVQK